MLIELTSAANRKLIAPEHLLLLQIQNNTKLQMLIQKKKKKEKRTALYLSPTRPMGSAWSMLSRGSL